MRVVLAAAATYALVLGQREDAAAAAVALGLTWVPPLIAARSGARVPRLLEALWLLGVALPAVSAGLAVYDHLTHWGKLVHAVESAVVAALAAMLVLGFRDRRQLTLPGQLAALTSLFVGITAGVVWELVEFLLDWVRYSDLQKSNADTMTDLLWSDLAAGAAALLCVRLYHHALAASHQAALGTVADCLFAPLGRFLDRHGKLAFVLLVLVVAGSIAGLWFAGRPIPGLPTD